jgi:hypothetical protein
VHSRAAAVAPRVATYVLAGERSAAAVLDALRHRRMFTAAGPGLEFWLFDAAGHVALPGDQVDESDWVPHVSAGARVHEVPLEGGRRAVYAELRDRRGALSGLSAAIWITTSQ